MIANYLYVLRGGMSLYHSPSPSPSHTNTYGYGWHIQMYVSDVCGSSGKLAEVFQSDS